MTITIIMIIMIIIIIKGWNSHAHVESPGESESSKS